VTEGRKSLGPGGAALVGWSILAAVNQALIAALTLPLPLGARALHRAYDAGQLLAVGVASLAAVELSSRLFARFPRLERARWARGVLLATVTFGVSMLTVEDDVTNAAARYGVPVWLAMLAASLSFGIACGATVFLRALRLRALRISVAVAGVGLGIANAFVLPNDYPAAHLMLASLAALLVAHGVEGSLPSLSVRPLARRLLLGALALAGLAALAVPPPQAVRRRLFELPSAVVAPFVARLTPDTGAAKRALVPDAVARSPWFRDRGDVPPVPPTGALAVREPKIVLLLTIDAMRADVLESKRARKRFPALTALGKSSAYFALARAPASSTRPSMASVFTGRYASQLRWGRRDGISDLVDSGPRLAELLAEAGVATIAMPRLRRTSREFGVGRGFAKEIIKKFPAGELVDRIIELSKGFDRPTFLYAHFGEPHAPYQGKGKPWERYLQEIERVDRELGRLVRHLDETGLSERTLLVISADHGEAFMEHGVGNHATIVYEEVARIPLLVRGPGVVSRRIAEPVTLLDITPTLLDVFGLPAPGAFMGQSLAPTLAGKPQRLDRPIAICSAGGLDALYVPGGSMKIIFDRKRRTVEAYDLAEDPGELTNLVDGPDEETERAIEIARYFFEVHSRRGRERISD
jgi:hypothetical protein